MLDAEEYRGALMQLGMHKVAHVDETLMNHMFRVCAILQAMKAPDRVCLAALFHGAYGTEALHNDNVEDIPEEKRTEVRAVVGPEVEEIIYHFSVMSYASLGKSFRKVMRPTGVPELKDRRTGEDLPVDRPKFDDLLFMKLGDVLAHMPRQAGHTQLNVPAEYGEFWEVAADYLSPDALDIWTKITGGQEWIDPAQG